MRIFRPKLKVTLISAATFIQVATIPMTNHCSDAHRSDNHSRDAYRSDKQCNDNHRSDKCCHDFHRSDNHCNEFRSSVTWKYKLLDFDYSFWFLIMSGFLLPHSQWTSHLIRWLQFPFGLQNPSRWHPLPLAPIARAAPAVVPPQAPRRPCSWTEDGHQAAWRSRAEGVHVQGKRSHVSWKIWFNLIGRQKKDGKLCSIIKETVAVVVLSSSGSGSGNGSGNGR